MSLDYLEFQRIHRAEKTNRTLCKVDDDFYDQIRELISGVGQQYRPRLEKWAYDIHNYRRNKVLMQAMRTLDTPPLNAISSEEKLYWNLVELIKSQEPDFLSEEQEEKQEEEESEEEQEQEDKEELEEGYTRIRIVQSIPAIAGSDGESYGPFAEGDEITLPDETARVLIDWEVASEL